MVNKIAIMIPAIIDQECAEGLVKSFKDNIISCNKDFMFTILLNIDDYCRKGCTGNVKSISNIYKTLESDNCSIKIFVHNSTLGLTRAAKFLFNEFLKTNCDYLLFTDDDCIVINKVPFSEIINLMKDNVIFRLSFGYDTSSHEWPFLINDIYYNGKKIKVFKNARKFCTENGTIFRRDLASKILNECRWDINYNAEDEIGRTKSYLKNNIYTIFFKGDVDFKFNKNNIWPIPKENHFIIDSIRYYRRFGWNK